MRRSMESVEIKGTVRGVDYHKQIIHFSFGHKKEILSLNIFVGSRKFKWYKQPVREKILDIIQSHRGNFRAVGRFYNDRNFISDEFSFERCGDRISDICRFVDQMKKAA